LIWFSFLCLSLSRRCCPKHRVLLCVRWFRYVHQAAILLRLSFGSGGVYLLRLVSVQHLCASGKIDAEIFLVVPRSFLFGSSCVCSYRSFAALLVESHRRDATATLPAAAHRCRACSLEQRLFLICWSSVSYSLSSSSCSVSCCDCSFPVLA
jgi:hypothetical protein